MNYIKNILPGILLVSFLLISCNDNPGAGANHSHDHKGEPKVEEQSEDMEHRDGLFLTRDQMKTIGLEFGTFTSIKVNDFVKTTGMLGLPPNAYSSVNVKTNGVIKIVRKIVEGEYIKKGETIAYLENPEFIATQQEYLEAKAQLNFKRLEVQRQKKLVESDAGVLKNLQDAQAQVEILEATTEGLSTQLAYLGISTASLTPATIQRQISIIAPSSGYISKINFHNGMFAQSSKALMDIISSQHLHLELDVFEKDIAKVEEGQKISYTVPALGSKIFYGVVDVIGREFNTDSKTVRVHGHVKGDKPTFVKDLFINAKIYLNDAEKKALPEKAIIKDGENSFIYAAKKNEVTDELEFRKINVAVGASDNGYSAVELIDPLEEDMEIVIEGAYYVYAQSKSGELSHEH